MFFLPTPDTQEDNGNKVREHAQDDQRVDADVSKLPDLPDVPTSEPTQPGQPEAKRAKLDHDDR